MLVSSILALVSYSIIETLYLSYTKSLYFDMFQKLTHSPRWIRVSLPHALAAYAIIVFGFVTLLFMPIWNNGKHDQMTYVDAGLKGFCLGLVMYGVYNFTNRATLGPSWSSSVMWMDLMYGVFVVTATALIFKSFCRLDRSE